MSAEASRINVSQENSTSETRQLMSEPLKTVDSQPATPKSSVFPRRKVNLFSSQPQPVSSTFLPTSCGFQDIDQAHQSHGSAVDGNSPIWGQSSSSADDMIIPQAFIPQASHQVQLSQFVPARKASDKCKNSCNVKNLSFVTILNLIYKMWSLIVLAFETVVIRQLAKLEANQKEMLKTLNSFVSQSNHCSGEADREYFASLPSFPISAEAELKSFDEYLRTEDNQERAVFSTHSLKYTVLDQCRTLSNNYKSFFL